MTTEKIKKEDLADELMSIIETIKKVEEGYNFIGIEGLTVLTAIVSTLSDKFDLGIEVSTEIEKDLSVN